MDRRVLLAVVLMMAVAILPSMFSKSKKPAVVQTGGQAGGPADSGRAAPTASAVPASPIPSAQPSDSLSLRPSDDTVVVTSPLYRYALSTRGGRLIEATLLRYPSMRPEENRRPAQILTPQSDLLTLGLLSGRDTVWLRDWQFEPSARSLNVQGATPLRLTARQGGDAISLT